MSVATEPNTDHRHADSTVAAIMLARGWARHESSGWSLDIVGGVRDDDPAWIRLIFEPVHAPPGWTLSSEITRFAKWLATLGFHLERVSMRHPALFGLVPGVVAVEFAT